MRSADRDGSVRLSPSQQECLEAGLRILARIIATAHLQRRVAPSQKVQRTAVGVNALRHGKA
jgi:hypothetical protein